MFICARLQRSRQAYYKLKKQKEKQLLQQGMVIQTVHKVRRLLPRLGGRKLYHMLKQQWQEMQIKLGRDRFFRLLDEQELLVRPKRRHIHTTNSRHRFYKHTDLSKNLILTEPNQLWVSDITYLRTKQGFCYLALITDAYSRKIVGYDVSDSLELQGCVRALEMALKSKGTEQQTVHHSDRGIQYCSYAYTDKLQQNKLRISMGEAGNCYDNALAERMNGILKNEFNLDTQFDSIPQVKKSVGQAIYLYNFIRPHMALNYQTPHQKYAA